MIDFLTPVTAKAITLPLALAAITVFSGCATTSNPEARSAYDQTQKTLASQPVAIISDGCLIRIENGKNDIMYQQSDLASVALAQTVKSRLIEKGVKVSHTSSPFICGSGTKEMLAKMDILVTADGKDQANTAYPIVSSSNKFDSTTNQAYLNLYKAIIKNVKDINYETSVFKDLGLDDASLNTIRNIEGANKVFVVKAAGSQPSMGARMTTGILGAVVLVAGATSVPILTTGQNYAIYLVNLETNQVEWSKSGDIKGNVFKMPVDNSYVVPKMLDPLYAE